jgi:hypothetical protein
VYVSYAENERNPTFFPNPWYGSPNTEFLGYPGPAYDSGGILIVNTGTTDVVLGQGAKVDGFHNGTIYQLWDTLIPPQGVTIHPAGKLILAQTEADNSSASCIRTPANCYSNFDSSDTPVSSALSTNTPVIHLTLNNITETFTDTAQVLNTGGFDFGNSLSRNESVQWRLVGTTGPLFPGGSGVIPGPVTTWHNDNSRTGLNPNETTLTSVNVAPKGYTPGHGYVPVSGNIQGNINATTFGKLFAYPVDGQVYAQPLFVPNVVIPGKGTHNVVFVATENNNVYAFDADTNSAAGGLLWGPVFLGTPMPSADICSDNVSPNLGVTGTPVIDTTSNTIYIVSKNKSLLGTYSASLHALDLSTGSEKFSGPVAIGGSIKGIGDGSVGGVIAFDPRQHFQRSALLLDNGSVYIAFTSHCDIPGFHGWIFGYDAKNLMAQTAIYNTTPNAISQPSTPQCQGYNGHIPGGGGIWMAGAGLAADATGIYATTGNGHFDANTGGLDYSDTVLKLTHSNASAILGVADYFTPSNQSVLECKDEDLGSSGPLLLPGSNPSLLVQTSKEGNVYLVNRATGSMGRFNSTCQTPGPPCDHIVQALPGAIGAEVLSTPAYFNNSVYFHGFSDTMKAFRLVGGRFNPTTPIAHSPAAFGSWATPSISFNSNAGANSTSTGVVWAIEKGRLGLALLHAYEADTLNELYNSDAQGVRDAAGTTVDFTVPTIAAGKVFVGTATQLVVYGGGFFTSWSGGNALGGSAQQICVSRDLDGRLEIFYVGTDNKIYHNYQTVANGGWSGESPIGGSAKQITVGSNQDGRLEIFYVGTDDKIYHNYQAVPNGGWGGENWLGGWAKQITVGRNQDGRLEIFYVGTDNKIYHNYQTVANGGWSGESPIGGSAKQITVGSNLDGRLEIFYAGTDDKVYHNYQTLANGGWSGESWLGGWAKQIAVGQNQDGRLEIFYVGTDNRIYHNYQATPSGGWSGEWALGGSATQIAVVQNQDGRLEVFYVGTDTAIYHNYQVAPNDGWNGEAALGGYAIQLAVAQNQDTRLEVFYVGTNQVIYHNYQTVPNNRWNH